MSSPSPLGSLRRTHTCGALRRENVGAECVLLGWVHTIRDHGGVLFLDVRDRFGLTQVVVEPSEATADAVRVARELGAEHVVAVIGRVAARPAGMVNAQLPTGDVEVRAREIRLLSPCLTLPFPLADEEVAASVAEDLRLRYRFLDLRRAELQEALELRHRVMQRVRGALSSEGFIEIGTPLLVRPTPEGARDFIVPARLHPGAFYALPQSPQLYKQILMVSGFDRYFQLATCLRDEDLRADRQPEHQQIDLEMSFVGEEDVWGVIERMFTQVMQEVGVSIATPFPRLSYADAMARFGSDKPDMRFAMELRDVSDPARASQSGIFQRAVAEGGSVYALVVPASHALSRKDIDGLEALAKTHGAGGLAWTRVNATGGADGGVAKLLADGADAGVFAACDATPGCTVLFAAGATATVQKALGAVRLDLGRRIHAPDPRDYRFVWIRDFPLFEWDDADKRWAPAHHMFCMPRESDVDLLETDPGRVYARQYDLALNGTELGSGSIRIHTSALQRRVMKVVGLSEEQAREKFGFLLEALDYGAPPHGGIALGVDRIIMHLAGRESIRDVIAFPKTARAASLMDGAPGRVDARDLDLLGIRLTEKTPVSSG